MIFKKVVHSWHGHKLIKLPKLLHFSDEQCLFTQNFAKQPYIFFVPQVLRIIFLPLITSLPRSKTQKWTKEAYFLGHPVEKCEILKTLVLWWLSTPCWVGRHHGNDTHHEWENGINKNFRKGMTIVIAHSHQCGDSDSYCNKRRKNTIKRA